MSLKLALLIPLILKVIYRYICYYIVYVHQGDGLSSTRGKLTMSKFGDKLPNPPAFLDGPFGVVFYFILIPVSYKLSNISYHDGQPLLGFLMRLLTACCMLLFALTFILAIYGVKPSDRSKGQDD
jgi:hypothetical protein